MNYDEALEFIDSTKKFGIRLGIDNMKKLLNLMDNPQNSLKVIHVAGTNGKGSTCAFINQMLIEAGFKVGLYTSPYLQCLNEMIKINNKPISNDEFATIVSDIKSVIETQIENVLVRPTEFEIMTAVAFEFFKGEKVDFAVVEVGMGGRLDATNVIKSPELCIITSIGFDHMDFLGDSIEKIAFEKAGIIKPGSTVVVGIQKYKNVYDIIQNVSEEKGAKLIKVESDYNIISNTIDRVIFDCYTSECIYKNLEIRLLGTHQVENALNCVYTFEYLQKRYNVSIEALVKGLMNTRWHGRFEIVSKQPLIILDSAHNADGMDILRKSCNEYLREKDVWIVLGILKDKEYEKMLYIVSEITNNIIFTLVPHSKRAFSAEEAREIAKRFNLEFVEDYKNAIEKGLSKLNKNSALLISGSIYLVGPARTYIVRKIDSLNNSFLKGNECKYE
ncbi:bifunctional folylpolyglutamate synthase/dihydrofolate synthase [Caldicellulosiruptor acetigenus]|uniref:Dihydrofolate synthase/folylpolyglutamate synthase n=1 Tax=Caldicellulosiruptor acetigenus 6A TaxID=632516 RepID=G2PUC3_9FIRM|nr:folylpolyglutamate synthase/dihydrofolate synthase family protein [Caldicellulosiruptor acetigenus]AEM73515.1 FolC bifunctional protein [Caldicellulosiruptor acetigenus 6A]